MAVTAPKKSHTIEDLWELSHRSDKRYELVKGELRELTPTGCQHGMVAANLTRLLAEYVLQNRLGIVLGAETGCVLKADDPVTVRAADVAFVSWKRLSSGEVPKGYSSVVPDLVVEVLSPSDSFLSVMEKVQDWLGAGTRAVWVVDPSERRISIHKPGSAVQFLAEGDTLADEQSLPGFACKVSDVFAVLRQE
ncbi:MAG: Uma2 family endonuclease [Chthonomonadetes bacterium]|nr:Uma2 family endonuclease [Chthonomonadetes bacterium]